MKKVRVYVACALTHASQEYKDEIELLKQQLRRLNWIEVLDFVGEQLKGDTDQVHAARIYKNDIHECVGTAHAVVAELSLPSIGLGWELGTSVEKHGIRTIMLAHEDALVSKMPPGASYFEKNEHVSFERYKGSLLGQVTNVVRELRIVHQQIN